jgi:segregation and condensation protein B
MAKKASAKSRGKSGDSAPAPPSSRLKEPASVFPRVVREESEPRELAESLGLDHFQEPDDAGLSLEELGEAYAALMSQGADPYETAPATIGTELGDKAEVEITDHAADEAREVIAGDDQSAAEVTPLTILEAMLFVGHPLGEPLTSEQIAGLMRGVRPVEIDELVEELNATYRRDEAVFHVASHGAGYRLELRPEWGPVRDRFYGRVKEARLSQSAVDVLAIVAYQQPINAGDVDRLRGKASGGVLGQLVRRDLLAIERPEPKSPPIYRTTTRFLDLFGLDEIGDLPQSVEDERGL